MFDWNGKEVYRKADQEISYIVWVKKEMEILKDYILSGKDIRSCEQIEKHADWAEAFLGRYGSVTEENVGDILRYEVGQVFVHVLEDAGVFKCTPEGREAFERFVSVL